MAVPAHDERDFEFAKKYNLPITQSIAPYHIDDTEVSTPRKDKETKERTNISAIIKHRKEDKYYVLNREKFGWKSFIIG
jgi:leucyl-tRNA synthetase